MLGPEYGVGRADWKTTDEEIEARKMPVDSGQTLLEGYTFDDVALVPKYSSLTSRTEPSLETWFTRNTTIGMPLVASNMDTVMGPELAEVLIANGGMPIMHRFTDLETQVAWSRQFAGNVFISAGFNDVDNLGPCFDAGAVGVCIDVAHGHTSTMIDFIKHIRDEYPDKQIIAGSVCTPLGYQDLVEAGAHVIRVGVGCGAACSTRIVTGFGVPQFTAIHQIAKVAREMRVPFIADGGIRNSRDVVLALAAGATSCMMGNLFAKTFESAAPKYIRLNTDSDFDVVHPVKVGTVTNIEYQGRTYAFELGKTRPEDMPFKYDVFALYRGQASEHFQSDYFGGVKKGTVPEGVDFTTRVSGSAQDLLDNLLGGLRSGMTYGGARTIEELQRKAEFIKVTSNYAAESFPRIHQ